VTLSSPLQEKVGQNKAMARAKTVRLSDVAKLAGVSVKTVSNVVHDYEHVSESMRTRVQEAIKTLGYRPNLTARRLVTGRTGMIALAIPETAHHYFSSIADAIVKAAEARGYRVLIEQTDGIADRELAVMRDREAGLVDGVIFQPAQVTSLEIAEIHADTPVVLLGEAAMPLSIDHVMIDNVEAAKVSVEHLLGHGRERIAFLGAVENDNAGATIRRLAGYQYALDQAGLFLDPQLVLSVESFRAEAAALAIREALESGLKFDGLLCRDDRFAVAALQELRRSGIRVPEDVAIVGWDDSELTQFSNPTITVVAPAKDTIATMAVDMLIERIEGQTGVGRHRLAPFTLEARESAP
jgi:DNA-binding LacI/PurR family transcriptional regulator